MVQTVTVYKCPNGHYEENKERAVAWWLVDLIKQRDNTELSFSAALELIKCRDRVKKLFDELEPENVPGRYIKGD